jgi:hypothetical protein
MIASQTGPSGHEDGAPWWRPLVRPAVAIGGCVVATGLFLVTMRVLTARHAGFWVIMGASAAFGLAIIAIISMATRLRPRTCSPAKQRYERRVMRVMTVYVVALLAAVGTFRRLHPTGVLAWALAIAPALPVVATIALMGLYLREETDEFERMVVVHGALWATGAVLSLATVWGFLEMFGLVPHLEAWWAFPVWAVIFGPAQFVTRRRYQ